MCLKQNVKKLISTNHSLCSVTSPIHYRKLDTSCLEERTLTDVYS